MAFSTEGHLRAWRLEDVDPSIVAEVLVCKPKEAKSKLRDLARSHGDPAWVDAALARLSVPALLAVAAIADHGGILDDPLLRQIVIEHHRVTFHELARAIDELQRAFLIVALQRGPHTPLAFTLVAPAAAIVAQKTAGLTYASPGTFEAVSGDDESRRMLAACCALAHQAVKATQAGLPNRASLKRVSKVIGVPEDSLDKLVIVGVGLGLLRERADRVLEPRWHELSEAAHGRFPRSVLVEDLVAQLQQSRKALTRDAYAQWALQVRFTSMVELPRFEEVCAVPGLTRGHVEEAEAVGAATIAGTQAGNITPSFEVFLPPEAALSHVVRVLRCAELTRLDRVLVAKLTKASIQRAIGSGATLDQIRGWLAEASKTPVPQNVLASIEDWAGGILQATTASGRVIVVAASEEARVRGALAMYEPRVLAPGVLLVDDGVPPRAITNVLGKLGFLEPAALDGHDDGDDYNRQTLETARKRLRPVVPGDAAMAERVVAYLAAPRPQEAPRSPGKLDSTKVEPNDDDHGDEVDDENDVQWQAALALLDDWERRNDRRLPDDEYRLIADVCTRIDPADRQYLLGARGIEKLHQRLREVMLHRGGLERLFAARPDVAAMLPPGVPLSASETSCVTWYADGVRARIEAAARTQSTLILDRGQGRTSSVKILRLVSRGSSMMVLGEDTHTDTSLAVPLHTITRIGEPASTESARWRPLVGQAPPAGHVACPCGSGKKYRHCCRD